MAPSPFEYALRIIALPAKTLRCFSEKCFVSAQKLRRSYDWVSGFVLTNPAPKVRVSGFALQTLSQKLLTRYDLRWLSAGFGRNAAYSPGVTPSVRLKHRFK